MSEEHTIVVLPDPDIKLLPAPHRSLPAWIPRTMPVLLLIGVTIGLLLYFLGLTPVNPALTSTQKTQATTDSGTLRVMGLWYGEGSRELFLRESLEQFSNSTGVAVDLKFPRQIIHESNSRKVADYIANAIRSNAIPFDVIWMTPTLYTYVAEKLEDPGWGSKYLVDFGEVAGFTTAHKPAVLADSWFTEGTGGTFTGPLLEGEFLALYYRSDVPETLGITLAPQPTWNDFVSYAQAVSAYNQRHKTNYGLLAGSINQVGIEPLVHQLLLSQLSQEELSVPTVTPAKLQALRSTFLQMARLAPYAASLYQPDWHQQKWVDVQNAFIEKAVLFIAGPSSLYNSWEGIDADALATIQGISLPSVSETPTFYSGTYRPVWAVFRSSPQREAASRFLLWFTTPLRQREWFRISQTPTAIAGTSDDTQAVANQLGRFHGTLADSYGSSVRLYPDFRFVLGNNNIHFASSLAVLMQEVALGERTPADAYSTLERQLLR